MAESTRISVNGDETSASFNFGAHSITRQRPHLGQDEGCISTPKMAVEGHRHRHVKLARLRTFSSSPISWYSWACCARSILPADALVSRCDGTDREHADGKRRRRRSPWSVGKLRPSTRYLKIQTSDAPKLSQTQGENTVIYVVLVPFTDPELFACHRNVSRGYVRRTIAAAQAGWATAVDFGGARNAIWGMPCSSRSCPRRRRRPRPAVPRHTCSTSPPTC